MDLDKVLDISSDGPSKSFAFRRLQYLEGRWNLYVLLNEHQEMADSKVESPGWGSSQPLSADLGLKEGTSQRFLQRAESRYPRPSFGLHEPEASAALYQEQDEEMPRRKEPQCSGGGGGRLTRCLIGSGAV